mmetsp:Transcript_9421/g.17439  ORF Transcript_9421/g.17439 Transcript_9421/m.17439 type:complete len:313 (+) Transcript_9421:40-978(+)
MARPAGRNGISSLNLRGRCVALCGLALLSGHWWLGTADVALQERPAVSAGVTGVCGEALVAGQGRFEEALRSWIDATREGRAVPGFGGAAVAAEQASLAAFDAIGQQQCDSQRQALQDRIRKEVLQILSQQRVIAERRAQADLNRKLLDKMSQRGGPLRIQEKMDLLQDAMQAYKAAVLKLQPAWVETADADEDATERRLGELQFSIEDSREGLALQREWEDRHTRDLMSRRAYGMSVSLDPALRVLVRPEGLGNLQVFSEGPVGPPSHPADVNFGVINDASMPDVYREHPVVPFLDVQPAVTVNLNLGTAS